MVEPNSNPWIIDSLLDSDFYKFTMGQAVWHHFPEVPVKYALENRAPTLPLADYISENELRRQLDHIRSLRFTKREIEYLQDVRVLGKVVFTGDYLEFLRTLELCDYRLDRHGDSYRLEFTGPWVTGIYWETPALAVVTELYSRAAVERPPSKLGKDLWWNYGDRRLDEKIRILRRHPEITFSDFGARRRFSRKWHDHVVSVLARELPAQFAGTSDVFLAMKHRVNPAGTFGHEMYMALSGLRHDSDDSIRRSHNEVLRLWWEQYGAGLSIALTDNYGSDFFFDDMTVEQARQWKGLRQDSGDPLEFGERAIRFYQRQGLDPREKLIIFSDGLHLDTILLLAERFRGRIRVTFGWGTNLTNDVGLTPPSVVIKLVEACGHGTVKLSDRLSKATGSPQDIERFMKIFGYSRVPFGRDGQ